MNEKKKYNEAAFILTLLGGIFIVVQGVFSAIFSYLFGWWGFGRWGMMPMMWNEYMEEEMYEHMGPGFSEQTFGMWYGLPSWFFIVLGIITAVLGIVVIFGATIIRKGKNNSGGIIALVIGAISLFFGTWLGGLFALIGGFLDLIE